MKRTPPVGMGYVGSDWGTGEVIPPLSPGTAVEWTSHTVTRPSVAITLDTNKYMMLALEAKVRALLPETDKYEWQIAAEHNLHMASTRLGIRLRNAHVPRDPKDHVDIYAVHDVYHLEQLVADDGYLKAVVDKLVGSLVRELARIQKERHDALSDQTERTDSEITGRSRLVRESPPSNPEVLAKEREAR